MSTIQKAERELASGNIWRAREILQGAIRTKGYDVELFENLGRVYLHMGDLPEAGRFLFFSGARKPQYEESINLFLHKYRNTKPRDFMRLLPRKARQTKLSEYPEGVTKKLRDIGVPEVLPRGQRPSVSRTASDTVIWFSCLTIGLVLLGLLILGLKELTELIRSWV